MNFYSQKAAKCPHLGRQNALVCTCSNRVCSEGQVWKSHGSRKTSKYRILKGMLFASRAWATDHQSTDTFYKQQTWLWAKIERLGRGLGWTNAEICIPLYGKGIDTRHQELWMHYDVARGDWNLVLSDMSLPYPGAWNRKSYGYFNHSKGT